MPFLLTLAEDVQLLFTVPEFNETILEYINKEGFNTPSELLTEESSLEHFKMLLENFLPTPLLANFVTANPNSLTEEAIKKLFFAAYYSKKFKGFITNHLSYVKPSAKQLSFGF